MMSIEQNIVEISRRIRALIGGEVTEINDRFYVRKKGHDSYVLRQIGNTYRARWGTFEQIMEDVEHVLRYGCLPEPVKEAAW